MPSNIATLDKAVNLRQLKMANDAAVHLDETTNPASEDVIDEYQRVLAQLYQALDDAQEVVGPARAAVAEVATARGSYGTLSARFRAVEEKAENFGFTASRDPMSLIS